MGRFTSLRRDSVSHMNYQSDYLGTLDNVTNSFGISGFSRLCRTSGSRCETAGWRFFMVSFPSNWIGFKFN